jgi:hypothetical protein
MLNGLIAFQTREKLNIPWKRGDEITKQKKIIILKFVSGNVI